MQSFQKSVQLRQMLPLQKPGCVGLALTYSKPKKVLPFLAFSEQLLGLSMNHSDLHCGMARREIIEGRQGWDGVCH